MKGNPTKVVLAEVGPTSRIGSGRGMMLLVGGKEPSGATSGSPDRVRRWLGFKMKAPASCKFAIQQI